MANYRAAYAVGEAIVAALSRELPADLTAGAPGFSCQQVSAGQLDKADADLSPSLTVWMHRVTMSEHLRNARMDASRGDARPSVALELHYLLTMWAKTAEVEQLALGFAMARLNENTVFDTSVLPASGGFAETDVVHVVPAELSTEDTMRIWDAIAPSYRLSVGYVARVVRIDGESVAPPPRTIARRLELGSRE